MAPGMTSGGGDFFKMSGFRAEAVFRGKDPIQNVILNRMLGIHPLCHPRECGDPVFICIDSRVRGNDNINICHCERSVAILFCHSKSYVWNPFYNLFSHFSLIICKLLLKLLAANFVLVKVVLR